MKQNRKMKKVPAFLLALVLLIGLLPVAALADAYDGRTPISSVSITGLEVPRSYMSTQEYIAGISVPAGAGYSIREVRFITKPAPDYYYYGLAGHFAELGRFDDQDAVYGYRVIITLDPDDDHTFLGMQSEIDTGLKTLPNYCYCEAFGSLAGPLVITSNFMKPQSADAADLPHRLTLKSGDAFYPNGERTYSSAPYLCPGDVVTLKADEPASGEVFAGWTVESGSAAFADASAPETTMTMAAEDTTITATYAFAETPVYPGQEIRIYGGYAASDAAGTARITSAQPDTTVYIFADDPQPGIVFNGWRSSRAGLANQSYADTSFPMPSGSITCTAQWKDLRILNIGLSSNAAAAKAPRRGVRLADAALAYSFSDMRDDIAITVVGWQRYDGSAWLNCDEEAFTGGRYRFRVLLTAKGGALFTEDTKVSVSRLDLKMTPVDETDGVFTSFWLDAAYEVADKPISKVVISGFENPVAGEYAADSMHLMLPEDDYPEGLPYYPNWAYYNDLHATCWTNNSLLLVYPGYADYNPPRHYEEKFEIGNFYNQVLYLIAEPEYYFAENFEVVLTDIDGNPWGLLVSQETPAVSIINDGTETIIAGKFVPCKNPGEVYYDITTTDCAAFLNGTLKQLPSAMADTVLTLRAYNYDGKLLDHYEVNGTPVAYSGSSLDNYKTDYTMPAEPVTITAVYKSHTHDGWNFTSAGNSIFAACTSSPSCGTCETSMTAISGAPGSAYVLLGKDEITKATGKAHTLEYAPKGTDAYTAVFPSAPGEYTARLTFEGQSVYATANFEIYDTTLRSVAVTNGTASNGSAVITEAKKNDTVMISAAPAPEGMEFDHWAVTAGGVTPANAASAVTTFTMPAEAVAVEAFYRPHVHVWSYRAEENIITAACACGEEHLLALYPAILEYWEGPCVLTYTNDITDATGLDTTGPEYAVKGTTEYGAAPSEVGEYAVRLSLGGVTAYADMTIVPARYGVTVTSGKASIGGTVISRAEAGADVTITADAAPAGKVFDHWTVTAGGVTLADTAKQTTSFTMPAMAVEITAVYEDDPAAPTVYGITVTSGKAADGSGAAIAEAAEGDLVTLTADPAPDGREFAKWIVISGSAALADETAAETSFTMPAGDIELQATYKNTSVTPPDADKFTVTVTSGKAADGSGAAIAEAAEGDLVTLTADLAPDGREFAKWIVISGSAALADETAAETSFTMPAGDVELQATYKDKSVTPPDADVYTVTFDTCGGTCSLASAETNAEGKLSALPTATRSGYTFTGWFDDAEGGRQITLDTVFAADSTVYAQWQKTSSGGSSSGGSRSSTAATYANTVAAVANGSVTVDRDKAAVGKTVTITVTPDTGYTLETLTVTDKNGKEIELTRNGDGTYSYKMPASRVTIRATFMEDNAMLNFCIDVHAGDWFYDDVLFVYRRGLMNGTSPVEFSPVLPANRAMIVTILYRLAGEPAVSGGCPMRDVDPGSYCADAVAWAAENEIVKGYDAETFGPWDSITREQLAAVLYRFADKQGAVLPGSGEQALDFADAEQISDYAVDAMRWCVKNGIFEGDELGRLDPQGKATRAQVAAILHRFCELIGK